MTNVLSIIPQVGKLNSKTAPTDTVPINIITPSPPNNGTGVDVSAEVFNILAGETKKISSGTKKEKKEAQEAEFYSISAKVYGDLSSLIKGAYSEDPDFRDINNLLQKPAEELSDKEKIKCRDYTMNNGMIFYTNKSRDQFRLCVPRNQGNGLRLTILYETHDSVLHGGIHKTYDRLASKYWWPSMIKDVRNYCNSCNACKRNASVQKRPEGARASHEIP